MTREPWVIVLLVASLCVTVVLTIKLWRSDDHIVFKLVLPLIGLIPIFGPLLMIWLGGFPPRVPWIFRDNHRYSSDVHDRWSSVHKIKDPKARLLAWKSNAERKHTDEPPGGSSPLG